MNLHQFLWDAARKGQGALPILSFPAAQKLHVTVDQLVKSSELQAQAMACIAHETTSLAAISLMDLSVEAEAFGAQVCFFDNEVPAITGQLVSDLESAEALKVPSLDAGRIGTCLEGVRLAKQRITDKPLLAGMIGPFSLAGRLMDVTEILFISRDDPDAVHTVLEKATEFLIRYGQAMKDAGADGIMMAEPLAGILSPKMAKTFSVPYVKQIIDALQDDSFAVIYHNCGNSVHNMLDLLFTQGAATYHFGNVTDMSEVMQKAPADILCMGNIDPVSQFVQGTPESMRTATQALLNACGKYENFILSSGCDIPSHANWENIQAFFKTADA